MMELKTIFQSTEKVKLIFEAQKELVMEKFFFPFLSKNC